MLASFKAASNELRGAVADVARRLATEHIDPLGIKPLLNNRLIPLDKNPGVRPIGIGETLRRIIGKAAGVTQVCAGHLRAVRLPSTPCVTFSKIWTPMQFY